MQPGRLFSYKLSHDTGFAPNPWWRYLTLATCKPGMRRTKLVGDWIAGFTSGKLCGDSVGQERLIYLMQVSEVLAIGDYFRDARFARKIPQRGSADRRVSQGDNIYEPLVARPVEDSDFRQIRNVSHFPGDAARDLGGRNVLVATRFVYFGREALALPADVRPDVPKGQSSGGQRTHDQHRVTEFVEFVERTVGLEGDVLAPPHSWPEGENVDGARSTKSCAPAPRKKPGKASGAGAGCSPQKTRC